jgi:hypothetical protein
MCVNSICDFVFCSVYLYPSRIDPTLRKFMSKGIFLFASNIETPSHLIPKGRIETYRQRNDLFVFISASLSLKFSRPKFRILTA